MYSYIPSFGGAWGGLGEASFKKNFTPIVQNPLKISLFLHLSSVKKLFSLSRAWKCQNFHVILQSLKKERRFLLTF
jgi:hypothetical protein